MLFYSIKEPMPCDYPTVVWSEDEDVGGKNLLMIVCVF